MISFFKRAGLALFLSAVLPFVALAQIPGGSGIVVNNTPVQGGTNGNCLYINGAVVGQQACGGGTATNITVGTTTITGGAPGNCLFDNVDVLGEQACGGAPTGAAGGELGGTYPNPTLLNSAVIGKVLTGYVSGTGTVAATDTILQAIQKLNGNAVAGPVGTAGGDLSGTYPNPTLAWISRSATQTLNIGAGGTLGALSFITPGTGVATALGVNVGSAGAFVTFNGAGGTPLSLTGTNITGTAAGLTAGTVTTNANLTGDVTSSGNATTLATTQTGAHTWSAAQTYSGAEINSTSAASGNSAKQFTGTLLTGAGTTNTLPQMLFQPTGSTAVTTWSISGTPFGINEATGFLGNFIDAHVNGGASLFSVGFAGNINSTSSLTVGSTAQIAWLARGIITSPAAATLHQGAADAATAVAQTTGVQGIVAGTNNVAGALWTFQDSIGTGTGASGGFSFMIHPASTTGSSQNAQRQAFGMDSTGTVRISTGFTIAAGANQLPAAGTAGRYAYVTDQLTTCAAAGAALIGGGAVTCPVFDNGTTWVGG